MDEITDWNDATWAQQDQDMRWLLEESLKLLKGTDVKYLN